jgi:hypothetical protein
MSNQGIKVPTYEELESLLKKANADLKQIAPHHTPGRFMYNGIFSHEGNEYTCFLCKHVENADKENVLWPVQHTALHLDKYDQFKLMYSDPAWILDKWIASPRPTIKDIFNEYLLGLYGNPSTIINRGYTGYACVFCGATFWGDISKDLDLYTSEHRPSGHKSHLIQHFEDIFGKFATLWTDDKPFM